MCDYDKEKIEQYSKEVAEFVLFKLEKSDNKLQTLTEYIYKTYDAGYKDGYDKRTVDLAILNKMPNIPSMR